MATELVPLLETDPDRPSESLEHDQRVSLSLRLFTYFVQRHHTLKLLPGIFEDTLLLVNFLRDILNGGSLSSGRR